MLDALEKEAARQEGSLSRVTLAQHLDTFLHTYVPTRGRKGEVLEDNLDSPLVELELLTIVGTRTGRNTDPIYTFRREEKPEITPELFLYCLNEFWDERHSEEKTLNFRDVAIGHGGPGQIFKLPEEDVRSRVEKLGDQTEGNFTYHESSNMQQIHRETRSSQGQLLKAVYTAEETNGC